MLWNVLTIILLILVVSLIFIRVLFTIIMYRHEAPIIKSADNNISTTMFERIANSLKERLGLHEWNVVQNSNDEYSSVVNNINWKTKTISITKFFVPSIGYEIDNLLGSIWFAEKLINDNKKFARFTFFVNVLSPLFEILFYFLALGQFVMWFIFKYDAMSIYNSSALLFLKEKFIFFFAAIVFLLIFCLIQTLIYGSKESIESNYEQEIAAFISSECHQFSQDIVAARTFALAWKPILVPVFARKASNLKYLGPFVIFK